MNSHDSRSPLFVVRGIVVLLRAGREVGRWPLEIPGATVDLGTIDHLCRLQLVAKGAGCEMRFIHLCPAVQELLDLAGLSAWVGVEVER